MHSNPHKLAELERIREAIPGNSTAVQCERLREALSRHSVTTYEAMRHLDVYDPRARVMQLRRMGHRIDTHWTRCTTECGATHRIGVYVTAPTPPLKTT